MRRRRHLQNPLLALSLLGIVLAAGTSTLPIGVAHAAARHRLAAAATTAHHVVGHGTAASCTSAAVIKAVAKGGSISFNCGAKPVVIVMRHTAKVVNTSHEIVLDGGGLVTLSGADKRRILYMNTCDKAQTWTTSHCDNQRWPKLVVRHMTFTRGNASAPETDPNELTAGGGAIFDRGGQLRVSHSQFVNNRCHAVGQGLGGAGIRARSQWHGKPIPLTHDVFRGGRCSNGSAISSLAVSWIVRDTVMRNNRAIGHGANPARAGTPGGGSGGAIYCDGDTYSLRLINTTIEHNKAREGGGAVFFVSNDGTGSMTIKDSTLRDNPSATFETKGYPGIYFSSGNHHPKVIHSTIK